MTDLRYLDLFGNPLPKKTSFLSKARAFTERPDVQGAALGVIFSAAALVCAPGGMAALSGWCKGCTLVLPILSSFLSNRTGRIAVGGSFSDADLTKKMIDTRPLAGHPSDPKDLQKALTLSLAIGLSVAALSLGAAAGVALMTSAKIPVAVQFVLASFMAPCLFQAVKAHRGWRRILRGDWTITGYRAPQRAPVKVKIPARVGFGLAPVPVPV